MEKMDFKQAYYIKLGGQGVWEKDLMEGDKARIGYSKIDINDVLNRNWKKIKKDTEKEYLSRGKKTGATQDYNALKNFIEATDEVVFVTFHDSKLYWCTLDGKPLQQDQDSKFRTTKRKWSCYDRNGKLILLNQISGRISKTQGFRGTICKINELDALKRTINAEKNEMHLKIEAKKLELAELIKDSFSDLHWSDMEILADLIFNKTGWQRVTMVGGKMKNIDIELEDLITKDLYQVQVKAEANIDDFIKFSEEYYGLGFKKLFFVVFKPDKSLSEYQSKSDDIQLITGIELADLVINMGLTNWLLKKIL